MTNTRRHAAKGWEAALAERLRDLPRQRAPARLRRQILAALAALEREGKGRAVTGGPRDRAPGRALL